jgi:flagellar biosynthetic protein FlhB
MAETSDSEQRTEEATPRRREEARERGQVALSSELVAAAGLAAGGIALGVGGGQLARAVAHALEAGLRALGAAGTRELSVPESAELLGHSLETVLAPLGAIVLPVVVVTALTGYVQAGLRLAPKALELDPGKLDPLRGLQRILSLRAVVRTGFSLAKIALIAAATGAVAWLHAERIAHVGTSDLGPLLLALGVVTLRAAAVAIGIILALAALDALFQRYQHERDLRMTRAEVKEDHRLTEGDPHVRARIRAVQRELAMRRMMADVPKATVVVTNPTHYAVALRYERGDGRAPVVLAKGVDHLAERIKVVARASGIACHEDVALARSLYARVRVGQEIPQELYAAVAAVIATVYRLQEARA